MDHGVVIGALIAVFGQFLGATSMLLMKRAAIREASAHFLQRRTFQFAFAIFLTNTVVLDAVIYALAPLTIVAPITALGVVFVNLGVAAGCFVDRERLTPRGIAANALIVIGVAVASACGPHSNTTPTLDQMYENAISPRFLAYAGPGIVLAVSCICCLLLKLLPRRSNLKVVWCAVSAAVFGSLSVLSFKGVATLVRLTLEGDDQLHSVGAWLLLLAAVICAPANVTLMNLTFEESDATYGMPLYQALLILATITSGGLFYDEFGAWATEVQHSDAPLAVVGFVSGVGILILGIVLVAYQPATGRTVVTPAASPGVASPGAGAGPLAAEEAAEETTDCFSCLTGTVAREPTRPSPPRTSASTTPNGKGSKSLW